MATTPSLIDRARLALSVFRQGMPARQRGAKELPMLVSVWQQDKPAWKMMDFASYVAEGFNINTLIYSAVMYKARAITNAPLVAFQQNKDGTQEMLDPGDPLSVLLSRPNIHQSGEEFLMQAIIYFNIAGENFTLLDRPAPGAPPTQMINLRPDRTFIIPSGNGIMGYAYVPPSMSIKDAIPILPEDMMHVKLPNPGDPLQGLGYGMSPIAPLAKSGDVDNAVTKFLKLFFDRGAMPPGVLATDQQLDPDQVNVIQERWEETYGGSEQWFKVGVLERGTKYESITPSFEEMGFEAIDERSESRILGPFGVPPVLLGTRLGLNRGIFNNYREARTQFWEDTFLPELKLFQGEYEHFLNDGNRVVAFDVREVPALRKNIPELVSSAVALWGAGTPINMALEMVGMPAPDIPGGDIGYLPFSLQPVGEDGLPKPEPPAEEPPDEEPPEDEPPNAADDDRDEEKALVEWLVEHGNLSRIEDSGPVPDGLLDVAIEDKGMTYEQKTTYWETFVNLADKWQSVFEQLAAEQLEQDRRAVLAIISRMQREARGRKETIEFLNVAAEISDYFEFVSGPSWRDGFLLALQGLMGEQGEVLQAVFGLQFDALDIFSELWFGNYTDAFSMTIQVVSKQVMSRVVEQAINQGWTPGDFEKRVDQVFTQWIKGDQDADDFSWADINIFESLPQKRSEAIARTEVIRGLNAASSEIMIRNNVKQREWLSTRDDRVRDTHLKADGQVQDFGTPFSVGGDKLQFPADPTGSAAETINCRCTVLPVVS